MPKKAAKSKKVAKKLDLSTTFIVEVILTIFVLLIAVVSLKIYLTPSKVKGASAQTIVKYYPSLEEEKKYWEEIATTHPTYKDAQLEINDINLKIQNP